jgi:hypothetical protein
VTPALQVFPQTFASTMDDRVILKSYACALTRHASGTSVLSGKAYVNTLV